jgi:hypothetical protein
MPEIYNAHQIFLYDETEFFSSSMKKFATNLKLHGVRKIREGVWEVRELVEA